MKYRVFKMLFKHFLLIILISILSLQNPHASVILMDPTESQSILKKITPMEEQKVREMLSLFHGAGALIWKENEGTAEQRAQTLKDCPTLLPDPTIANAIIDEGKTGLLDTAPKAEELFLNYFFQRHMNMDSISSEEKSGLRVATLPPTISDLIVIYNFIKDPTFEEMARKHARGGVANYMPIYIVINDYLKMHSREFETIRKDSSPATEENYFRTMALALLRDIQKAGTSTDHAAFFKKLLKLEFDLIVRSYSSGELTPKEIIGIAETFSQSSILNTVSIEVDDINHNQFRLWRSVKPFVSYGLAHLGSLSEECILSNIAQGKCLLDFPFPLAAGERCGELIKPYSETYPKYLHDSVDNNIPNLSFGYSLLAGLLFDSRIDGVGACCYSRLLTTDESGEIILRNKEAKRPFFLYSLPIYKKELGYLNRLFLLPTVPLLAGIIDSGEGFHPRLARAHPNAVAGLALKPIVDESLILGSGFQHLFLEGSRRAEAHFIELKHKRAVVENIKRRHLEDFDTYRTTLEFTTEVEHAITAYTATAEFATEVEHKARATYAKLSPIFPHVFHAAKVLTRMKLLNYNGYVYGLSSMEDISPSGIPYAEIERQIIQNQIDMLGLFLAFIKS